MIMLYIGIILFLVSLYLIFSTVFNIFFPTRTVLDQALDVYEKAWEKNYGEEKKETRKSRLIGPLIDLTKKIGFRSFIQEKLEQGGIEAEAGRFILFHIVLITAAGLLGLMFFEGYLISLALIALTAFIPMMMLNVAKSKRERLFHDQLPETLMLISGSLRAGYSFMQAVDTIVKEMRPPMSIEFQKVLSEARLGLPVEQAMDKMAARFENSAFKWVVMAVKIQREIGGNLAEVLDILAASIQERDQIDRQVRVLTAEGRLSALILFLLPFFLGSFLFFVNRSYILLLFSNLAGLMMVGVSLMLMGIGALWLRKIVRIEV